MTVRLLLRTLLAVALAWSIGCGDDDSGDVPEILRGLSCEQRPNSPALADDAWDGTIEAYERSDAENPPQPGAVVFVGSSSVALWGSLAEDLAPLPALNRGFGGSVTSQAVGYVDRIVTPYQPSAVVLYEGDNDIAFGISPECVLEDYDAFVAAVRKELPDVPIYFLSIKPSLSRAELWEEMQRTNRLVRARTTTDSRLHYIDVATPMFDASGKLRQDIFLGDGLHMNAAGYEIWTSVIRPILLDDLR